MLSSRGPFDLPTYLIDRSSRLWSVALPALMMTCILDVISCRVNPTYYMHNWGDTIDYPGVRIALSALFSTELWGRDVALFSNSPYWSLSYEAWFYLIFGFCVARKPLLLLLSTIVAGPNILFLMIPWLMGVVAYEVFVRARSHRDLLILCACSILVLTGISALVISRGEVVRHFYNLLQDGYFEFFHVDRGRVTYAMLIGPLMFMPGFMVLLSAARLLEHRVPIRPALVRGGRALGEFTFPLYLLHFPSFVLCGALGFYNRHSSIEKIAVFVSVCTGIFFAIPITTVFRNWLRKRLSLGWSAVVLDLAARRNSA